eukprot:17630-Eustigmatos_ZCMA.PRE.1
MRASALVHPQLGKLWDRLSVQMYAIGYAGDSVRAALTAAAKVNPIERPRQTRTVAGILHFLTPEQMATEIVRLDASRPASEQ